MLSLKLISDSIRPQLKANLPKHISPWVGRWFSTRFLMFDIQFPLFYITILGVTPEDHEMRGDRTEHTCWANKNILVYKNFQLNNCSYCGYAMCNVKPIPFSHVCLLVEKIRLNKMWHIYQLALKCKGNLFLTQLHHNQKSALIIAYEKIHICTLVLH